jgi:DNA replication protein DnaC
MQAVERAIGLIGCDADGPNPGDYLGPDGLLVCGRCGERKQKLIRIPLPGPQFEKPRLVPVSCRCQREAFEAEKRERANQEAAMRLMELRKVSLMDAKFREATFDRFRVMDWNKGLYELGKAYATDFDKMESANHSMLFTGTVGCGKSFLAACICNALLDKGVPLICTSMVKLLGMVKGDDCDDVIGRMRDARLLVIDDLGAERGTDYALERVYDVVDSRYRMKKPVIFTTNLSADAMAQERDLRYWRVYDRVLEICAVVSFPSVAWRKAQGQGQYDRLMKTLGL